MYGEMFEPRKYLLVEKNQTHSHWDGS